MEAQEIYMWTSGYVALLADVCAIADFGRSKIPLEVTRRINDLFLMEITPLMLSMMASISTASAMSTGLRQAKMFLSTSTA